MSVNKPRIVCQFSCGAASAVATKLAIARYSATHEVVIVNAFIVEEDSDNRRFLADCEKWFGQDVVVLRDEKYGASVREVWRKKRYIKGLRGAPCSKALKRDVLDAWRRPDDIIVLGYTVEERDRYDDFIDRNNIPLIAPLVDAGLTKDDCFAMIKRAGIELPRMYALGFPNANCKGCCKGGMGYWNHMRKVLPGDFAECAEIEADIGPSAYMFRDRATGERIPLTQLPPDGGRLQDEPSMSCSFFCEMAEQEIAQ